MINELIDAISIQLNAAFGDEVRIYQNEVAQGLSTPCFFIAALDMSIKPMIGRRIYYENPFDICYLPKGNESNTEMMDTAGRMADVLRVITIGNGDKVRGSRMRYGIQEGALHFYVSYNLFRVRTEETETMGEIRICMEEQRKG